MCSFEITRGNRTFTIPSKITVGNETVELSQSNTRITEVDDDGNLTAVEFNFDTLSTGTTSLVVSPNMYGRPNAHYGTIDESRGEVNYEHPDDRPYDTLPDSEVSQDFIDGIDITEHYN